MDSLTGLEKVGLVVAGVAVALVIEYVLRKSSKADQADKAAAEGSMSKAAPSAAAAVKAFVEVEYCGGYFYALKKEIVNKFDTKVEVTPLRNPGKTGNFEVRLKGASPELIHSKTTRKQGRCETEAEVDAVLDQIEAFLSQAGKKGN